MLAPPPHPDEFQRLAALRSLGILDSAPERGFDDLVQVAATLSGAPIALVSLVDECRQWFKAKVGLQATETPRDLAFCAHAILDPRQPLIVPDARLDPRFSGNPLVVGAPHVVFYAGIPLCEPTQGLPIGTLCVIDHQPRNLPAATLDALRALARLAEERLSSLSRLRQSQAHEARLDATLAACPVGIYITDPQGACAYVNPAWCRIAGMTGDDAKGSGWATALHPEDRAMVAERWQRAARERQPFRSQHRFLHADGTSVMTSVHAAEILANGAMHGYVGMVEDITERQLNDAALRASETRLLEAQDLGKIGHWSFDIASQVIHWSPQVHAIFGRPVTMGAPSFDEFQKLIHPDDLEMLLTAVALAIREGVPYALEHRILHPDDGLRQVMARGHVRRNAEGLMIELTGTVQDITAVVRTREELRRAKDVAEVAARAKADFLATMSHEIRTPLNGIIGMTDLLQQTELSAEQRDYAENARASGQTLLTLINDILDFSKLEAGKVEMERVPFAPRTVAEEVIAMIAERAQAKAVELYLDVDATLTGGLIGDPHRLKQVLINLVGNAVKFTDHGEIAVRLSGEPLAGNACRLRITVRDTGIGIPAERLSVLFQAFQQVANSISRRYGGTGLGLAISQRLVHLMGGEISVSSEAGEGSVFTVRVDLPTATVHETFPTLPEGLSALVIDDHLGARAATSAILSDQGISVTQAATVDEAERLLNGPGEFQVVIIDGTMPGMAANAFIHRLHQPPPVVLTTEVSLRGQVPAELFCAVIVRPVRRMPLLHAIASALGVGTRSSGTRAAIREVVARKQRILVAEDNPVNQMVAAALLRKLGYEVDVVADGRTAVEATVTRAYDLVLMDCLMPILDGYGATREIRSREHRSGLRRLPVVALTANALEGDRNRCLASGMDDYITKPFNLAQLRGAMERWVAS